MSDLHFICNSIHAETKPVLGTSCDTSNFGKCTVQEFNSKFEGNSVSKLKYNIIYYMYIYILCLTVLYIYIYIYYFTILLYIMLRLFSRFQVATTCFSCSPPVLNLLLTIFMFVLTIFIFVDM